MGSGNECGLEPDSRTAKGSLSHSEGQLRASFPIEGWAVHVHDYSRSELVVTMVTG